MNSDFFKIRAIIYIFIFVFIFLILVGSLSALKNAHHEITKVDATGNGEIRGIRGRIEYSNPNLNGGYFSYQRIAILKNSTSRYIEIGWSKREQSPPLGFNVALVWGIANGGGSDRRYWQVNPAGTYDYQIIREKNPLTEDVYHRASVFSSTGQQIITFSIDKDSPLGFQSNVGERMIVGGETTAVFPSIEEDMVGKHVFPYVDNYGPQYGFLQWLKLKTDGTTVWKTWKDATPNLQDNPYWSIYNGYNANGGVLTTCGKASAVNCSIPLP